MIGAPRARDSSRQRPRQIPAEPRFERLRLTFDRQKWMYRSDDAIAIPELTETAQAGARLFASNCALCHGTHATGTDRGPPLVHEICEPDHHADAAFHRAVNQGVASHHWSYGNMAPVPGVSHRSVTKIVAYVRELQRANGIH